MCLLFEHNEWGVHICRDETHSKRKHNNALIFQGSLYMYFIYFYRVKTHYSQNGGKMAMFHYNIFSGFIEKFFLFVLVCMQIFISVALINIHHPDPVFKL